MKKCAVLFAIVFLLTLPCIVGATPTPVGSGTLLINWSEPTYRGYYLDYKGTVNSEDNIPSSFDYTIDLEDIFCVSEDHAQSSERVDFFSITSGLDCFGSNFYDNLRKAVWVADHWLNYEAHLTATSTLDDLKGEAQKAVWDIMNVLGGGWVESDGIDKMIIDDIPADLSNYNTANWYYAHSPTMGGSEPGYQDYITPAHPTPEPGTMLLFGAGCIGLASLRKRLKRS